MFGPRIESGELTALAAREARRRMRVSPGALPRLAGLVVAGAGEDSGVPEELAIEVGFDDGPEGFPRVHLTINGQLALECQRCLRPNLWQLELETLLTVLRTEDELKQIQDPFDCVFMGDDGLNIEAIVEDEILAALPIALVHGPESECAKSAAEFDSDIEATETNKPFADLGSLMGRTGKNPED